MKTKFKIINPYVCGHANYFISLASLICIYFGSDHSVGNVYKGDLSTGNSHILNPIFI